MPFGRVLWNPSKLELRRQVDGPARLTEAGLLCEARLTSDERFVVESRADWHEPIGRRPASLKSPRRREAGGTCLVLPVHPTSSPSHTARIKNSSTVSRVGS